MAVVVVGNGPWSAKLRPVIESVSPMKVTTVGARDMINKSVSGDIFWLATTPTNQLRILPAIPKQAKVVLEKPAFLNSLELELVYREYMERQGNLYFSLPWNYSTSMASIGERLASQEESNVRVNRGGPVQRSYIPSYLDWLPHDLGMISRLPESANFKVDAVVLEGESIRIRAHLLGLKFHLDIGLFENRVAKWEISNSAQGSYQLDLYEEVATTGEEPLKNMFSDFLSKPSQSDELFTVWRQFFRAASLG